MTHIAWIAFAKHYWVLEVKVEEHGVSSLLAWSKRTYHPSRAFRLHEAAIERANKFVDGCWGSATVALLKLGKRLNEVISRPGIAGGYLVLIMPLRPGAVLLNLSPRAPTYRSWGIAIARPARRHQALISSLVAFCVSALVCHRACHFSPSP
jgi:hypothetical protein